MTEETKIEQLNEQKPVETPKAETVVTEPPVQKDDAKHLEMIKDVLFGKKTEEKPAEESVPAVEPVVEPPKAEEVSPGEPAKHEEPPAVEEVSPDASAEWDVDLLARAADMGVTDAYIEKFLKTPARLESYLSKLTEKKGVTTPVTDKSKQDDERFEKSLEGVDEEIAKTLREERAERKRLNNEIAELREQSVKRDRIEAERQETAKKDKAMQDAMYIDSLFAEVAKEHPEVGTGNAAEVIKDQKAFKVRQKLLKVADALALDYGARSMPDDRTLLNKAVQLVLGATNGTKKADETRQKLEKQQFTFPPSHSESAQPPKSANDKQAELDAVIADKLNKIYRR